MKAWNVVYALIDEGAVVRVLSLRDVLDQIEPVDYGVRTWSELFDYIDRNHYAIDSVYWERWLGSIRRHGIRQPVQAENWDGRWVLRNGHHRIWAARRLGLDRIPVRFVLD